MKSLYQTLAFAGANLLALTAQGEATVAKPEFRAGANHTENMTEEGMRVVEAAHLRPPGLCKWGHAAFEPVKVGSEVLSAAVHSLHLEVA